MKQLFAIALILPTVALAGWSGSSQWSNGVDAPAAPAAAEYFWSTNAATSDVDLDEHSIGNVVNLTGFGSTLNLEEHYLEMDEMRMAFEHNNHLITFSWPISVGGGDGLVAGGRLASATFDGDLDYESRKLRMGDGELRFPGDREIQVYGPDTLSLFPGDILPPRILAFAGDVDLRFRNDSYQGLELVQGDFQANNALHVLGATDLHGPVTSKGQTGVSVTNQFTDSVLGPVTMKFVNGIRVQ